jgi:pSer/pThr/pTyr-binding forkhead associated (FHA) protein
MKLSLVVLQGPLKDTAFTLSTPGYYTVGRSNQTRVPLAADVCVSRRHFALHAGETGLRASDLESLNGILVNGVQFGGSSRGNAARPPEISLHDGDRIQAGETLLLVRFAEPPTGANVVVCHPDQKGATGEFTAVEVPRAAITQKPRTSHGTGESGTRLIDLPTIPGHDMLRLLGSGSCARIFLARHAASGEFRAVKTVRLLPNLPERTLAKFEREVQTYQALRHPKIVGYHDHGFLKDFFYVTLEYMPGGGLDQLLKLRGGRLPVAEALPLLLDVLEGMAFAHEHGYIHRDLKPSNILLTDETASAKAKVSDLGLAKSFVEIGGSPYSTDGDVGGSYGYMPREQLLDFRNVRPVSDVFALGATFYTMITGNLAYDLTAFSSPFEMILEGKVIPVEERLPSLEPALAATINRALAIEAEQRWQTAGEFRNALAATATCP